MKPSARLHRRHLLAGMAAVAAITRAPSALSDTPARLAIIDWAILETALALGFAPAAAAELRQFARLDGVSLPPSIVDIGLRGSPNVEALRMVGPERIIVSNFYAYQAPVLSSIAPVDVLPVHEPGKPTLPLVSAMTREFGRLAGCPGEAASLSRRAERTFAQTAGTLSGTTIAVVSFGDANHLRLFGGDSLFGGVVEALGAENAWPDPTAYSASAPVGIDTLVERPAEAIAVVGPLPAEMQDALPDNPIWNALPAVRAGRVALLGSYSHFGGLPTALAFAADLVRAARS